MPVVELSEVLHQVRDLVGGAFRQRGVLLEMTPSTSSHFKLRLDPLHGGRIIAQILNALRAGLEPGATIAVTALREGGAVVLELRSDQPMAQSADRRDDWLTTGHGLWVARQLLDRLGGRLDADLPAEPSPCVWRVVLPGA